MATKKTKTNSTIVTGQTKSGIKFAIDKRITDDSRTMYYIRQMRKYRNDDDNKLKASDAVYDLLELIFGSGEGLQLFMNEVAAHHDGVADGESLFAELNDIFEAAGLKNSSSSQT